MTAYRLYALTGQDHVARTCEAAFADDHRAVQAAKALGRGCYAVEIWRGELLVARLGGELVLEIG